MTQKRMKESQHKLLRLLGDVGPMTRAELEPYLGVTSTTVSRRITRLRARGLLRIVEWRGTTGRKSPVYAPADGEPDVPEPPRDSSTVRNARYRRQNKAMLKAARARRNSRTIGIWAGLVKK